MLRADDAQPPVVLLVDDDPDIRRIMSLLFRHAGMTVMEASDGAEAVAIAGATPPDAVVADVQMPNMDGLEMVRRLHALPASADIPVLLFSGKPPHPELESVLRLDHVRFFSKGDPRKIIAALERLFSESGEGKWPASVTKHAEIPHRSTGSPASF